MHTQSVEDIDAVMGRFQAWAGSRIGSGAKLRIRELSCEEALESGRYYWQGGKGIHGSAETASVQDSAARPQPPQSASVPVRSRKAGHKPSAKARSRSHEVRPQARATASKAAEPKAATKSTVVRVAAGAEPPMRPAPFKDALARAIHPDEVVVSPMPPAELTRQVAISIRLADSERALIRARAAEAGVTVSAYVRQCALEVEQLRAQVQQRLETIGRKAPAPSQAQGVFARLLRRFFPSTARTLAVRV